MFKELEDAIISATTASALGPYLKAVKPFAGVNIKTIEEFSLLAPGVFVGVLEGKITPVAQKFQCRPDVLVWCLSQDLGRQDLKVRKDIVGAYAIMETMSGLLWGQDFGLGVQRLAPKSFGSLHDEELKKVGLACYYIVFGTGWTIQPPVPGAPLYIQKIGLDYFLEPERDMTNPATQPDASDLLTV